jgi:hypothetical protein
MMRSTRKKFPLLLFTVYWILILSLLNAQEEQGKTYPPPTQLITVPTAGVLSPGTYSVNLRIQNLGGLSAGMLVGISKRFQFGIAYGANSFVGNSEIEWHPRPEVSFKYRLIDETTPLPGIAFGLETQGYGPYNAVDSLKRYNVKAYGLYAVASKNWRFVLGNMGIHGGLNINFIETEDGDTDPNLFIGVDVELNPELSFLLEYNAALNENDMTAKTISTTRGGYLNAAVRWTIAQRLHVELDFDNLLYDSDRVNFINREIQITYVEYFK